MEEYCNWCDARHPDVRWCYVDAGEGYQSRQLCEECRTNLLRLGATVDFD